MYGVEPYFAASYTAALKAGTPMPAEVTPTLADGLAVPVVGPHAFEVAKNYVDECVLCTEKEISLAVLRLIENEKMVVEGGKGFYLNFKDVYLLQIASTVIFFSFLFFHRWG